MTAASEPDDFEAVVRRAGPAMLAYARRRVDRDTAEDVVGEALLVLWRRRHELLGRDGGGPRDVDREVAWAIGITRGCLANAARSARRNLALVDKLASTATPPDEEAPGVSEGAEELCTALASLCGDDQELLGLWAWDDLKPSQIATILGTSPQNVSVRLHRAKHRLALAVEARSRAAERTVPPTTATP